jgi:non-ribosomal peptide synthetase component F
MSHPETSTETRMTATELHRILVEWNDTARPYPADKCVHELVEAQAARNASAFAVEHESRKLSYGELNARANQLARVLRVKGVSRDVPVAVCLKRSLELPVALLAVLKAGGLVCRLTPIIPRTGWRIFCRICRHLCSSRSTGCIQN